MKTISDSEPIEVEHNSDNPNDCKCGGSVCGPHGLLAMLDNILTPPDPKTAVLEELLERSKPLTVPQRVDGQLWVYEVEGQQYLEVHTDYGRIVYKPVNLKEAHQINKTAGKALAEWAVEKANLFGLDHEAAKRYLEELRRKQDETEKAEQEARDAKKQSS